MEKDCDVLIETQKFSDGSWKVRYIFKLENGDLIQESDAFFETEEKAVDYAKRQMNLKLKRFIDWKNI